MILLDTHVWVWWMARSGKLSSKAAKAIETAEKQSRVGVSVFSCWEVAMLVTRGRLGLSLDVDDWIERALELPSVSLLELTPKIAVLASRLDGKPPADPADRILIATAKAHACPIITKDHEIQNYGHVQAIW